VNASAWRVRYRDNRRPFLGQLVLRVIAENRRRAAAVARAQLEARHITATIEGVSPAI
jgi:hypothetical protein